MAEYYLYIYSNIISSYIHFHAYTLHTNEYKNKKSFIVEDTKSKGKNKDSIV